MPQKLYPFRAFGFEFQLPLLAVYALATVVVLGVTWGVLSYVYLKPEQVLITLKELAATVEEYSLHAMEEPEKHELFEDADGKLALRVYKDHCVMIQRQTRTGVRTKLVIDLARQNLLATHQDTPPWSVIPTLLAAQACNRGCLNPHPGTFSWRYGQQHGEWVEVWRTWPDGGNGTPGCQHVQMFQPRTGMWDTNPDGTPRVLWRCCVH